MCDFCVGSIKFGPSKDAQKIYWSRQDAANTWLNGLKEKLEKKKEIQNKANEIVIP